MEYAILNSKIPAEGNRDLTSAENKNIFYIYKDLRKHSKILLA